MGKLDNKIAIVTGGARGIGRAICLRLASEGAFINIWDVLDASETVKMVEEAGGKARYTKVDITNSADVTAKVDAIVEEFGSIDIMVNNAGVLSNHENLLTVTDDIWAREITVDLTGTFYCTRAVIKHMIEQKSGKVVNIGSLAANTGRFSTSPAYSAAKAGVLGLTRSVAKTVAKHGINVNAICPGIMRTEITDTYDPALLEKLFSEVPYPRGGKPEDIASAVLFLASSDSDYVNGETLRVNGGSFMA